MAAVVVAAEEEMVAAALSPEVVEEAVEMVAAALLLVVEEVTAMVEAGVEMAQVAYSCGGSRPGTPCIYTAGSSRGSYSGTTGGTPRTSSLWPWWACSVSSCRPAEMLRVRPRRALLLRCQTSSSAHGKPAKPRRSTGVRTRGLRWVQARGGQATKRLRRGAESSDGVGQT